jgi:hypothetical protein
MWLARSPQAAELFQAFCYFCGGDLHGNSVVELLIVTLGVSSFVETVNYDGSICKLNFKLVLKLCDTVKVGDF